MEYLKDKVFELPADIPYLKRDEFVPKYLSREEPG